MMTADEMARALTALSDAMGVSLSHERKQIMALVDAEIAEGNAPAWLHQAVWERLWEDQAQVARRARGPYQTFVEAIAEFWRSVARLLTPSPLAILVGVTAILAFLSALLLALAH